MASDQLLNKTVIETVNPFITGNVGLVKSRLAGMMELSDPLPANLFPRKAIHELRVSVRRCQSVALAFEPYLPSNYARRIKRTLAPIRKSFNDLRDLDVLLEWISGDGTAHLAATGLIDALRAARNKAAVKLSRRIAHKKFASELISLSNSLDSSAAALMTKVPTFRCEDVAVSVLMARAAEVTAFRGAIADQDRQRWAKALHRLRIVCKDFRYTLELLMPLMPGDLKPMHERFCRIQDNLGALHDCLRFAEMLTKIFRRSNLQAEILSEMQCELGQRKQRYWEAFQQEWQGITSQWFGGHIVRALFDKGGLTI